jgi:hypothetical protein
MEIVMNAQNVFLSESRTVEARELLEMDEQELMELLVQRLGAIQKNVELSLQPTFEVASSSLEKISLPPWIEKTVDVMVQTSLRQTYSVVCSSEAAYSDLRKQLLGALGVGGAAAVLAFSAFLISTLGLAAALATVVATIVIKKIGEPAIKAGHQTMCEELKKIL